MKTELPFTSSMNVITDWAAQQAKGTEQQYTYFLGSKYVTNKYTKNEIILINQNYIINLCALDIYTLL